MNNVYCSQCGCKNSSLSKFCCSCGNKLMTAQDFISGPKRDIITTERASEVDEDGIPTTFRKPAKFEYEIQKSKNKFSVAEILSVPPSQDRIKQEIDPNFKIPELKDYLKQSLRECSSSRTPKDVDEG